MPTLAPPDKPAPKSEWESFANIRQALEAAEAASRAQSESEHAAALQEALAFLKTHDPLPKLRTETRRTDVTGLLRRLSHTTEDRPRRIIILTDLADTHYKTLPPIPAPQGDLRVLVLFIPAQAKDARRTLGKALSGLEQYDLRISQLHEAASWIKAAPHFSKNLADLLD